MAKKKLSSLSDLGGFVFSTNPDADFTQDSSQDNLNPRAIPRSAFF